MLAKLKALREDHENGFTLIELLVVILIIGILASIAIPVFLNQRKTANDSAVESDVKNAVTAVETWITQQKGLDAPIDQLALDYFNEVAKPSADVTLAMSGSANAYCVLGSHANGKKYTPETPVAFDSTVGVLGEKGQACGESPVLPGGGDDGGTIVNPQDGVIALINPKTGQTTDIVMSYVYRNGKPIWYNVNYVTVDGSPAPLQFSTLVKSVTCSDGNVYNGDHHGQDNWIAMTEYSDPADYYFNVGYDGQFPNNCNATSVTLKAHPDALIEGWTVAGDVILTPSQQ